MTNDSISDYLYFLKYKNNLSQFIIQNCAYSKNKKRFGRINLNERQLTELLKELNRINIYLKIRYIYTDETK